MARQIIRKKGVAVRRLALSVLMIMLAALLAGCGGDGSETQKGSEELTAPTQETELTEETTRAPPRDEEEAAADEAKRKAAQQGTGGASTGIRIDPNSPVPPDVQIESFRLGCQTLKAQQAEGQEAVDAYFQEAISTGTTMAEVLSGRGYECTDEEVHVWQRQD
jgi:hypothetical protein